MTAQNLVNEVGFGRCVARALTAMDNPQKSLNVGQRGQPIYYDKTILGCEEKNLGRVLPPAKFFSNKASSILTYRCSGNTPQQQL